MKKKRLIPVLLLKNGTLVKSKKFSRYQKLGNPVTAVKRLSEWASDELIYLDITHQGGYDLGRDDLAFHNRESILDIVRDVAAMTFMPITVGGGIVTLHDIEKRLFAGADKVSINTIALENPEFIRHAAKEFGSQCIVVSIDYVNQENTSKVYSHRAKEVTHHRLIEWARKVESEGAGEILLNSVECDGIQEGYDIGILDEVANSVKIPVIACGGVGDWQHLAQALDQTKVDALAAANIFHYSDQSVYLAKKFLYERGYAVRNPELLVIENMRNQHEIL